MSEVVYIDTSILGLVLLVGVLLIVFWLLLRYLANCRLELDRIYNLSEIGYVEKVVSGDLDLLKLRELYCNDVDKRIRKAIQDKILKDYFDDDVKK